MKILTNWMPMAAWLTIAAVIFTGCSSAESVKNTSQSADKSKSITLRFSWWGSDTRHQATLAAIELYKKTNPHVTIEAEYGGFDGYDQKIKTQLAGGTAPDIMQLDAPWLAELNKSGELLLDLGKQKTIDLTRYDSTFLKDFMTVNEETLGLPMGINGRTMLINKTLADQLGVSLDQPFTWDSLLEAARKVREQDAKYYLLNADAGIVQMMFTSILRQRTNAPLIKDDNTLSFNKEQAAEGFEWVAEAYDAGVFQPYGDSQLFSAKLEQNPKWINQEFLGIDTWSSEITKYSGALPQETVTQTIVPPLFDNALTGASLVRPSQVISVNKKSEHIEEAAKFVNWLLTDKEAAVALGDSRAVPAVESSRQAIVEAKKLDIHVSKAVEVAAANPAIPDNMISQNSQINEVLKDVLQKVAFKKLSPAEAADELIERFNEKISEIAS